jgi:hypothetical protein
VLQVRNGVEFKSEAENEVISILTVPAIILAGRVTT